MNIEYLREICLSLPGTDEAVKYGDQLCFMVAGKHFCSSNMKNLDKVNLKVADDRFDALCEQEGIRPAPYGGAKFKWIQVENFEVLSDQQWQEMILEAYNLVKAKLPKKVQEKLI